MEFFIAFLFFLGVLTGDQVKDVSPDNINNLREMHQEKINASIDFWNEYQNIP